MPVDATSAAALASTSDHCAYTIFYVTIILYVAISSKGTTVMYHHHRFVRLISGMLLASTTLLSHPSVTTAQAITATCYGASCNGIDPGTTTCKSDATIVASKPVAWTTVYRYYSPSCNAYYAMVYQANTYYPITAYMEANRQATARSGNGAIATSKMWESGRACVASYSVTDCV
jgi:hypothetical protein